MSITTITLPNVTYAVQQAWHENSILFAKVANGVGSPYPLYYSTDNGATWGTVDDAAAAPTTAAQTDWIVYGGSHYLASRGDRVAYSTTGTSAWTKITGHSGTPLPYFWTGAEWGAWLFWDGNSYAFKYAADPTGSWTTVDTGITQAGLTGRWCGYFDGRWWFIASTSSGDVYVYSSTNKTTWTGGLVAALKNHTYPFATSGRLVLSTTFGVITFKEWDSATDAWATVAQGAIPAEVVNNAGTSGVLSGNLVYWAGTGVGYRLRFGVWETLEGPANYDPFGPTDYIAWSLFTASGDTFHFGDTATGPTAWRQTTYAVIEPAVRETAVFNDGTGAVITHVVRESAVLNDAATDLAPVHVVRETAGFNDAATSYAVRSITERETATFSSRAESYSVIVETVRETAAFNDAASDITPVHTVRETAVLSDAASSFAVAYTTVRETAVLNDRAATVLIDTVRESAVLNDAATDHMVAVDVARETAVLNDAAHSVGIVTDTVRETAVLNDAAFDQLIAIDTVRERAFISSDAVEPYADTAWTANVQTWAMSHYDSFPYESLTDGYAAGRDGLYVPGTETVTGRFTTGDADFDIPQVKRMESIYAVGTHDEPMTVEITADVRGRRHTEQYTQMAREAEDERTVRCKVGHGFLSNRYRVTLESEAGFTVHSLETFINPSTRRI